MPRYLTALVFCAATLLALQLQAATSPGQLLEQALAQRADVIGDVVEMNAADRRLLGVYQKSQLPRARGAVLLLHAPGSNADDTRVIRPLRLGLADAGWNTLVLQLPQRFDSDSPGRWLTRNSLLEPQITTGLEWLKSQGQLNQVLLGVGATASAALSKLGANSPAEIQALVLVSAPVVDETRDLVNLSTQSVPVLDVYADRDLADVADAAPAKRRVAINLESYRQRTVPGAVAGFEGTATSLVNLVRAWLAAHADGHTLPK